MRAPAGDPGADRAAERPSARLARSVARRRAERARRRGHRPVLTGRALVLGGIVVLLVVVLAAPVNRYLESRHDVGAAAGQLNHDRRQLGLLERQHTRWSDPGYVQQQARRRLQFAMPGDTVYVVARPGGRSDLQRTSGPGANRHPAAPSWNTRLWDSLRVAGQ